MTQQERINENLNRENERLRYQILNLEKENKLAHDLIKQHEQNQREMLRQLEQLNALPRHKELSDNEAYARAEEIEPINFQTK